MNGVKTSNGFENEEAHVSSARGVNGVKTWNGIGNGAGISPAEPWWLAGGERSELREPHPRPAHHDLALSPSLADFLKTAFVQIGPKTCKQVQKRSGSGSGRFFKEPWKARHKTQQGSTPPTHLAPGKHAQTPTTHAH